MPDFYICPDCGAEVRVGSAGCSQCNQIDPWEAQDNEVYDGLDLPDDSFDYDDFVEKEWDKDIPKKGIKLFWWITAVVLLIALLFAWVF